ncbi:uncharacterized protein VTP21DRAFT_6435 [Calcarisporiella thermophila]|uniref:uncharacterized protein n=1 Tax=Calcarisporiella thermophila TaxID=911321 RepID=UPI003742BF2F
MNGVDDDTFYHFVDEVLKAIYAVHPKMLVQFEDFSSEHAFGLLEKYQNKYFCFNDDIQGTGAVILSGFINAVRNVSKFVKPTEHRILFFGAGSAGVGVAKQLLAFFIQNGIKEEDAKRMVWLVDSKGLVTFDRGDKLAAHKTYFARDDNEGKQYKSLMDVIEYVKPTALIGLSAVGGVFTPEVLRRMGEINERPIVFPLSNPLDNAECTFEDAMRYTDNRVVFASGTAFPVYRIPGTQEERVPGQGNNMYIFPGLGFGSLLAKPAHVTDEMVYTAADALAHSLTEEEHSKGWLYPSLKRIREVSAEVAAAVCVEAVRSGLARGNEVKEWIQVSNTELLERKGEAWRNLVKNVQERMWDPRVGYGIDEIVLEKSKI